MIVIRELSSDDWSVFRELRLAALAEAPYAFGSTLAGWKGTYDSEARWRARLETVAFNVAAQLDERAVGMVSGTRTDSETVELLSMWVAPSARGRGVGDQLVGAVCRWALERQAERVELKVYKENQHALTLYQRNGFSITGRIATRAAGRSDEWLMARMLRS